jgi:hypothetical protein
MIEKDAFTGLINGKLATPLWKEVERQVND